MKTKNLHSDIPPIAIIGSGNLAWHIVRKLTQANIPIAGFWTRNTTSAYIFQKQWQIPYFNSIEELCKHAEIIWILIKDSAIPEITSKLLRGPAYIHSSGYLPINILPFSRRIVIYPLMSFVKNVTIDWTNIPVFITAEKNTKELALQIAKLLSPKTICITDEQRQKIHRTAVILNNIITWIFSEIHKYLKRYQLNPAWFTPILNQTFSNWLTEDPAKLLTGPLARGDFSLIEEYIKLFRQEKAEPLSDLLHLALKTFLQKSSQP